MEVMVHFIEEFKAREDGSWGTQAYLSLRGPSTG